MQRSEYGLLLRYCLPNLSRKVTQNRWLLLQPTVVRLWMLINMFIYIPVTFYLRSIQVRFYVFDGLQAASGWLVAATILLL